MWLFEKPLFDNGFLFDTIFSSATLKTAFIEVGVVKLGHLTQTSIESLAEVIRSTRVLQNLVNGVWQSLSAELQTFVQSRSLAEVGEWREERGLVLTLKAPALGTFSTCPSKQLYSSCVKLLNFSLLAGVRESKWTEVLGSNFSPNGSSCTMAAPVQSSCQETDG